MTRAGRLAPALVLAVLGGMAAIAYASELPPSAPGVTDYTAHCASCHGAQLQGGVHALPLSGPVFEQNWAGKRARMLYSRIISTMPQNDPGALSPPDAFAIALYVFSSNGIGWSGHTPAEPNDLNTLTIPGSP